MRFNRKEFAGWVLVAVFFAGSGATAAVTERTPAGVKTLTLALKFVEFARDGHPILTRTQAVRVVESINSVYAQCGLQLRLEEYDLVDPAEYGLNYKINSADEMDSVRAPFDSSRFLVVIHTDAWDHGPMGPANAWTAMPGQVPAGAVLEAPVAANGNITAHELGHYLGLDHAHDHYELMNPIIYGDSIRITPAECRQMRATALATRSGAIRKA